MMQDNRLFISPVGTDKPIKRVLDGGCGTGIWAIDFGAPPLALHKQQYANVPKPMSTPRLPYASTQPCRRAAVLTVPRLLVLISAPFNQACKFDTEPACSVVARPNRLTRCRVPPNLEFFADDLERDWNFHQPFDLVYFRMMTGSIKDWPRLFEQAFQ